jgi:hypothetical protein
VVVSVLVVLVVGFVLVVLVVVFVLVVLVVVSVLVVLVVVFVLVVLVVVFVVVEVVEVVVVSTTAPVPQPDVRTQFAPVQKVLIQSMQAHGQLESQSEPHCPGGQPSGGGFLSFLL